MIGKYFVVYWRGIALFSYIDQVPGLGVAKGLLHLRHCHISENPRTMAIDAGQVCCKVAQEGVPGPAVVWGLPLDVV